jgi:hypothetical protein
MKAILKLWRSESALIVAVVLAVAGVITLPGPWGKALGVLLPLLGGGAVRSTVYTGTTLEKAVQAAAGAVASQLNPSTVGGTGEIPVAAQAVVDGVVAGATGGA